ncbi:hypothetical protein L9G16_08430 [Shewanella sp. A25]|nr:hypothetical protein [Shewanella shenzhenensis]
MNRQNQTLTVQDQHLPSLSSKVMFWRPRYLADSQWLQHIPFYFWLTQVLQPKTVVEPSLNSAVGYFAICQAVDKLNLDTFTYAAYGKHCDTNQVKNYNHEHYREFSQLIEANEKELVLEFDKSSIDLLLLKQDSELLIDNASRAELLSRLSDNAVVLIHGSKAAKVRKLCNSLRKTYLSFELNLGQGLLLLCMGKHIPERLEALINQAQDVSAVRLIQSIYASLGSANEDAWHRQKYERQVHELKEQLQQQTHIIQQIQDAKQLLTTTLEQANSDIKAAKAQQVQLTEQLIQLGEETEANHQQKLQIEQEKHELDKELAQLRISRDEARSDIGKLQQDIDLRFDELARLTQMLLEAEAKQERTEQDNKALQEELRSAKKTIEAERNKTEQLLHKLTELNTTETQTITDNERLHSVLQDTQQQLTLEQKQTRQYSQELQDFKRQFTEIQKQYNAGQIEWQKQQQHLQQRLNTVEQLNLELQSSLEQARVLHNSQLQQHKTEYQLLQDKAAELSKTEQKLQSLNALLERDQQVAAEKISKLTQSELSLQQALNERFDELAILTQLLQEKEQQLATANEQLNTVQSQLQHQTETSVSSLLRSKLKATQQRRKKARQFAVDVELIRQSELFDEIWYLKQHPEAAEHKYGAAGHYLEFGVTLAANPSSQFDGNWYLHTHQDVNSSGMNPLYHYLKFGSQESRLISKLI